jgi:RNA polymerase sigma-70 factor (ECF subfamily)
MSELASIWEEHHARLRGYISRRVREPEAVDDILQEVFLKALEKLHTLRSRGSVAAWLYRITAHAIADHFRAHRPLAELPEELAAPDPQHDPVAELATCLEPFINDIPPTYREALRLSELEGVPQTELAERLGISYSGTKSRVQRGREQLRRRFEECCVIETGRHGIVNYERRGPEGGSSPRRSPGDQTDNDRATTCNRSCS